MNTFCIPNTHTHTHITVQALQLQSWVSGWAREKKFFSTNMMMLKCCFTSTETVGSLGTGAQDGHLDFHTAPELWSSTNMHPNPYTVIGIFSHTNITHFKVWHKHPHLPLMLATPGGGGGGGWLHTICIMGMGTIHFCQLLSCFYITCKYCFPWMSKNTKTDEVNADKVLGHSSNSYK